MDKSAKQPAWDGFPTGTVTFLFTDIEGSTRLWDNNPETMKTALARHDSMLKDSVESNNGHVVKTTGDGIHAVFSTVLDSVRAAMDSQRQFQRAELFHDSAFSIRVRMGLHTGEAELRDGDYYGGTLNRAARVMGIGHGGQILLSGTTAQLVSENLTSEVSLLDLGEHRLKGIAAPERIFQLCHPDLGMDFPALRSLAVFKHNLNRQLSSFIGRETELAEVKRLLKETQLLTLLGPGGTGKTRLMVQVAEEVIEEYPDGVWLVELAPVTDPALIPERVAAALNVQEQPGRPMRDMLVEFLRRKEALLLLDNIEHIVQATAAFTEHLLKNCTKLKILLTGREALFIDGETTIQIPSLSLPEEKQPFGEVAKSEGVQLFLERARSVRPGFELNEQNAADIAEIVRRLDGIPLALELAAARLRMLTVEQVAVRLNDRFRLLTGGRRTALPRQQTLQALIDWSWNLLDEQERVLLRRLSVFSGGWRLEAAQTIVGFDPLDEFDVFDALEQLINKSLVTVQYPDEGEVRYSMLESIHQYARDRLSEVGEEKTLRDRHAGYYTAFSEQASQALQGRNMVSWLERLFPEKDNARAARKWALKTRFDLALRMAGVSVLIARYWFFSAEDIRWLEQVVTHARTHPGAETDLEFRQGLAKAVIGFGAATMLAGDYEKGRQVIEEGIELARDVGAVEQHISGLNMLLIALFQMGEISAAEGVAEMSLALSRQHDLDFWHLMTLGYLVPILVSQGEGEQAIFYAKEAIRLAELVDNPWLSALTSLQQARLEEQRKNWEQAEKHAARAADLFEAIRDPGLAQAARSKLGHIKRMMGDLAGADQVYRQTILAFQERGHAPAVAHQLECMGIIAARQSHYSRAARLLGAAEALRQRIEIDMTPPERNEYEREVADLKANVDHDEFVSLWDQGRAMDLDQAIEYGLGRNE